ncbi:hypothetical protein AB9F34_35085, partial [Rhizobium leguminosarum]
FEPEFLAWLSNFQLPEYDLSKKDGQYVLDFHGSWKETTMWEIRFEDLRATIEAVNGKPDHFLFGKSQRAGMIELLA